MPLCSQTRSIPITARTMGFGRSWGGGWGYWRVIGRVFLLGCAIARTLCHTFAQQDDVINNAADIDSIFMQTSKEAVDASKHTNLKLEIVNITEEIRTVGGFMRRVILVNGQMPGAPIRMKKGEMIAIKVINNLETQPTSLHCHGIHFTDGYSWYDGAHMISECGVPPKGGEQTYIIRPGSYQSGTYFCHSHYRGQYVDGFRFGLIIETDEYDKNFVAQGDEYIADLHDWHKDPYDNLLADFINPHNPEGIEPTPETCLVNGKNENKDTLIKCSPGKEILLRVINSSGLAQFYVFIDGHDMRVVELDGIEIVPKKVEVILLGAAQRASIIFKCDAGDTSKLYTVRFMYDLDMFDSVPEGTHEAKMFISYNDAPAQTSVFEGPAESAELLEKFSEALANPGYKPKEALPPFTPKNSKVFRLDVDFIVLDDFANHGTFNKIAYSHPQVPAIYSMFTLDDTSYAVSAAYGSYTNTHIVEYDDSVTIVLRNLDMGDHPFHLHGYSFDILKIGSLPAEEDEELRDLDNTNPLRSDTIVVKSENYAVIRFRANNPGVWMFHCHVQWHLDSGLGLNIISLPLLNGVTSPNKAFTPPPLEMLQNCNALGVKTRGNAVGRKGVDLAGEIASPKSLPYFFYRSSGIAGMVCDIIAFIVGMTVLIWYGITK